MPQPCSRPLTPNPFETYRDPVSGRWLVRYPADALAEDLLATPLAVSAEVASLAQVEDDALTRFSTGETTTPVRRRWESPSRTKVA